MKLPPLCHAADAKETRKTTDAGAAIAAISIVQKSRETGRKKRPHEAGVSY
ncbi:hypothetical protein LHL23_01115 [Leisingera sp. McT4-56]|nr:hypothetical protein [Leisingera sp. McT4-56]